MRIAIVPQLVPVENDVAAATVKTKKGNSHGGIAPPSWAARNSPVRSSSHAPLSDQARISTLTGIVAALSPAQSERRIAGAEIRASRSENRQAATSPLPDAQASNGMLLAVLNTSRHADKRSGAIGSAARNRPPPPENHMLPMNTPSITSIGASAVAAWILAPGEGPAEEACNGLKTQPSPDTFPCRDARRSAAAIAPKSRPDTVLNITKPIIVMQ